MVIQHIEFETLSEKRYRSLTKLTKYIKTGARIVDTAYIEYNHRVVLPINCRITVIFQPGHAKTDRTAQICYRCKAFDHAEERYITVYFNFPTDQHWKDCNIRNYALLVSPPREQQRQVPLRHKHTTELAQTFINNSVQWLFAITDEDRSCKDENQKGL